MPITLHVEFTGLCLYVVHPLAEPRIVDGLLQTEKVRVYIPRCRRGEVDPAHEDTTEGKFHVGYLRLDLAGLDSGPEARSLAPANEVLEFVDDVPEYEVVHRLNGEELSLDVAAEPIGINLGLPHLKAFAPTLKPRAELEANGEEASQLLVFRTTLTGGKLIGRQRLASWKFSKLFNPGGQTHVGVFAEEVIWTRSFPDGTRLAATLTKFGARDGHTIPLKPVASDGNQTIRVKIANLCCENPLEWNELSPRELANEDEDFKWLYRLLEDEQGRTYEEMLGGPNNRFPIPVQTGGARGGQGCVGLYTVAGG